jgi:hypothetical protein
MKAGRKKGTNKTGGRTKGTPNRTTKQARKLLEQILFGQIDNINDSLNKVRKESEAKYLDACSKLFTYVLPKKTDVTSDDKPLVNQLPLIQINTNGN